MAIELKLGLELRLPVKIVLGSNDYIYHLESVCYLEGERHLHSVALGSRQAERSWLSRRHGRPLGMLGTGFVALPGNHGAGVRLAGGGGGGAQLGEPTVAGLQAGHGASEIFGPNHFGVVHHFALVGGDLQGGQHIVHPGQVGRSTCWHAVELPLQDVEARPPGHV